MMIVPRDQINGTKRVIIPTSLMEDGMIEGQQGPATGREGG